MDNTVKKIAILIGGEFREFENAHKSWTFLNNFDFDLFISTWDMTYERNENLNINLSELVTEDRINKYFPNAIINITKDIYNIEIGYNIYKYVYHWRNLYEMLVNSKCNYDTIILTIPDINFSITGDIQSFIENIKDDRIYSLSDLHQLPPPDLIYVNDVFFMGKSSIIKKMIIDFSNLYNINNIDKSSIYKSTHYHLGKFFVANDIYIDDSICRIMDFFIMRSINRKFLNEDFESQKKHCLYWWNMKHRVGEINI